MRLGSPAWFLDLTRGTAADRLDEGSAARPDDGSAEAWLAQAVTRRALGEREPAADDAVLALHRGLTGVADQVLAWRICGDVRYDTGFYRDAEAAYTRAQRLDPACAAAYLGRAESQRAVGDLATTAADYATVLLLDATEDQRAVARRERARASIGTQPRDAEHDLRVAAAEDAEAAYLLAEVFTLDSANERLRYGQHLFATGRHRDAIAAVSTALSVGMPDDERRQGWELLGRAHLAADEFAEAIEVLSRLVDEAPTARAYQLRGRASYEAGLDSEARADLDRAIALDPGDAGAYRCRGELALAAGAYQDAVADLTRAVTLAPGDPDAWYYRAYVHSSVGQTESKHGDLLMAERAGHRNAAIVRRGEFGDETAGDARDLGLRAWRSDDLAVAVSTLDGSVRRYQEVSRAPNDTADRMAMQVRANLGSAKLAAGDVDGGLADLRAVVAGRPLFYTGWLALGRGQLQHESPATALPALDRAVALLPLRADAYVLRGRARQELDRHPEAVADLTRAIELEPAARELRFEARRRRAASGRALGQWGDAATDLEAALELATYDEADEVRAELVQVRASDPVAYERDRTAAFADAARGRVALLREWDMPDGARPPESPSDPVPYAGVRLPAAGATVVFTPHDDGCDEVTVETDSVRRLDLPPLPARSRIASVSPDGRHLLVGSGTLIREVQLPDGEPTPVLQGTWYTQAAHLTDGLAVVLASGAAVTLPLSDPDVRALLEVRGYVPSAGETSVVTASNDALYLIDIGAGRDDVLLASIAVAADRMTAVRGGRFLVLRRTAAGGDAWMTAVLGLVGRRLVLLGWFEADLGDVVELDGRVYGANGYELIGLDMALADAPEQVLTSIAPVMSQPAQQPSAGPDRQTGALRIAAIAQPPRPPRMAGVKELVGPSGAVDDARHGRYALAFTYQGDETYRVTLAVCDESGRQTWLRPIEPPLVGRLPRCAFTQDAAACLVAIGPAVHEVDCATGTARVVLDGDEPVVDVAAVAGGFAVIRRRQEYEGQLEIYRAGESTVSSSVPCGPMDSLTAVADGRVLVASFTNQLNDLGRLQSYVFAVRDADARLIGPVDLVVERGWDVGGRCILGTTARTDYEVTDVDAAVAQAFAGSAPEPPDLVELSGWTHPTTFSTYLRSSSR